MKLYIFPIIALFVDIACYRVGSERSKCKEDAEIYSSLKGAPDLSVCITGMTQKALNKSQNNLSARKNFDELTDAMILLCVRYRMKIQECESKSVYFPSVYEN